LVLTEFAEIGLIDEKVDHPDRIVFRNIVFQLRRKHRFLTAIRSAYETAHLIPRYLRRQILKQNQHSGKAFSGSPEAPTGLRNSMSSEPLARMIPLG
jgi:hypothetical protein